tara:strand:- start:13663 stop:14247 length:585 start_codon:yes stop_codon:yes gene_type:complete
MNSGGGARLDLVSPAWVNRPSAGDSIAVDGCCLTVVESSCVNEDQYLLSFDVVQQTLDKTVLGGFVSGRMVNLETSATPETLLGGHLVQGHVDSVAQVLQIDEQPGNVRMHFRIEETLAELLVPQGSITIDGVSLTIADVSDGQFQVALIPTTLEWTNLSERCIGDRVNIESDILLRSIRQLMVARGILPAIDQ